MGDANPGWWRGDFFALNAPEWLLTDDFLMRLSALNKGVRMERTADGVLTVRPPVGGTAGIASAHLTGSLWEWERRTGLGVAFGCVIGYHLPNGALRSPDASWTEQARWDELMRGRGDCFPPLCPDFVAELVPAPHERTEIEGKVQEYIANGARLGWLIDPQRRKVEVYRPGKEVEVLDDPKTVAGDPELPGFVLDFAGISD